MALETILTLSEETVERLQELIQANVDSYHGFNEAADRISDAAVAQVFRQLALERSAQATELETLVEYQGRPAERAGSIAASLHRLWIDMRALLTGGHPYSVLAEAERGEGYLRQMYEDALHKTAGSAVNDVLQRQYVNVRAACELLRGMREARSE